MIDNLTLTMKKDTVIFDLDGTLALIDDRRAACRKEDGKIDFEKFYLPENVWMDKPNEAVIRTAQIMREAGFRIFIFSGRSANTREETIKWLKRYGVKHDRLLMRPMRDGFEYMPDNLLKQHWLDQHFPGDDKDRILCTYDDRQKVVNMWRRNGITCMQVDDGDF